jgi:hypothetical protein
MGMGDLRENAKQIAGSAVMNEQQQPGGETKAAARLHEIARLLREKRQLDPEEQRVFAELADALGSAWEQPAVTSSAPGELVDRITHLADALHQGQVEPPQHGVRERIEQIGVTMEARAPHAAALARQLVEVLAGLGI